MTKTEEFRLHNLFIKFKNEGWAKQKLQEELQLDSDTLEKWEAEYEEHINKLSNTNSNNELFSSQFNGVDEKGNPLYEQSLQFQLSPLEKAKFDMQRMLWSKVDSEFGKELFKSAQKYLPVIENYFKDISITINEHTGKYQASYTLNTNTQEVNQLAKEAMSFYVNYYSIEYQIEKYKLIKYRSEDIFKNAINILPYSLKQIEIRNFNGISEASLHHIPIDTQWIFFLGENSFGKTTLLQAIVIGITGQSDIISLSEKNDFNENLISVEYFSLNRSIINNMSSAYFTDIPHLACYGPSRLQIQTDQTQNDIEKKSATTYSLFNSDGILLNIEFELLIWHLEKNPKFDSVKNTFLKIIPYLADIQVDVPQRRIYYIEKEPMENGGVYKPVRFEQLASGFRSIIAMVGDMMIRLFKSQSEIIDPSELAGIVIIDELDLHWHPKMQREIPNLLSTIFPKVQFIASTHSLVPLLGAPENSLLLKVNRTAEEGITVEKVDIDFKALSADTMLRDIFDLEKYMSDEKIKAWERYRELKSLIRFEENITLKESYLDEYEKLGDKYHFSV